MQDAVVTQSRRAAAPGHATSPAIRPSRDEIEPAVLALLSRHSAGLLATARRYSASPEDAEDAYQRGVEILLTKAPTTREDELLPWLKTVVKHEAFAVRESNGRAAPADDPAGSRPDPDAWTDERAERYDRLRLGAEALATLKPQEVRCLLLRAEGLSYREICEVTGWTYTKVNRCITEGRRAFLKRIASIESGAECERLQPLISKAADGEASPAELRTLRPHLKTCLACKATLREYRATPGRLAGLVPPVAALAGMPAGGGLTGFAARVLGALQDRLGMLADGPAAQKAAAVAASAAVLAGGGAAGINAIGDHPARVERSAFAHARDARARATDAGAAGDAGTVIDPPSAPAPGSRADSPQSAALTTTQTSTTTASAQPARPASGPVAEFDPGTPASEAGSTSAPPPSSTPPPATGPAPAPTPSPAPGPASTPQHSGSTTAEFGP